MKVNLKTSALQKVSDIESGKCFKYVTNDQKSYIFIKLSFEGTGYCDMNRSFCFAADLETGNVWAFNPNDMVVLVNMEACADE